jgi:hypothetical protein
LRHAEVGSLDELPAGYIAKAPYLGLDEILPIVGELVAEKTTDVLQYHRRGIALADELERLREEVTLVVWAEPVPGARKRRAGNPTCEEVNLALELGGGPFMEVELSDRVLPSWASAKCVAAGSFVLDEREVAVPRELEPVRLAAGSGADFD